MPPAWQARSVKQQRFVRGLAREVRDRADEAPSYELYVAKFISAILRYIAETVDGSKLDTAPTEASQQFAAMVPRIKLVCLVESERPYIAHLLFRELEPCVSSWAQRNYLRDQVLKPKEVFGAPSAMAEIELDQFPEDL